MEFSLKAEPPQAAFVQVGGGGGHAQLLAQLPQGRADELRARRDVPGRGNIVAAGVGILGGTAHLQKHLHPAVFAPHDPDMAGAVAQPLGMGRRARHALTGGDAVFIDNIKHFGHGEHFLIRFIILFIPQFRPFRNFFLHGPQAGRDAMGAGAGV